MTGAETFPRVLIVTDASFSGEARGLERTLINLFEAYPKERLLVCAPKSEIGSRPPKPEWKPRVCPIASQPVPAFRNRLGALVEPLRRSLNTFAVRRLLRRSAGEISRFEPEIVFICATSLEMNVVGEELMSMLGAPAVYYAMDDARDVKDGGSVKRILQKCAGLLYISENLSRTYTERYALPSATPRLIVHNPVRLDENNSPEKLPKRNGTFRLAYAGSVWQMHFDALKALAEAVAWLRANGKKAELVLYTGKEFWEKEEMLWEFLGVSYGGFVPYERLTPVLQDSDLLVLASSFLPAYEHLTRASVQTKVTDYMATGRAILCVGPEYSVGNRLLKSWDCAVFAETNDSEALRRIVDKELTNREEHDRVARRAFALVREHFEIGKVQRDLYRFLSERCRS